MLIRSYIKANILEQLLHPAIRPCGEVVTTSLCTQQQRLRNVSNETPNNVSLERRQDVSVVDFHDVLLERRDNVLKGHNNDVPSVRSKQVSNETPNDVSVVRHQDVSVVHINNDVPLLHPYDISCKSQIKQLITLLWYVSTTSRSYVIATVSTFSS